MKHKNLFSLYIFGFLLSLICTLCAYILVVNHILTAWILIVGILLLAFIQLTVQLIFFLHVGQEEKPYWNLLSFLSTAGIIFTIIVGALWIMGHLNYNMSGQQMDAYIMKSEGMHY